MLPWDKDLTFGKDYGFTDYQIPDPYAHPFFSDSDHPKVDGPVNWMVDALLDIPEIKQMYLRRLRTLMDEFLQPLGTAYGDRYYENRFDELYAKLMGDPTVVSQLGDLQQLFQRHQDILSRSAPPASLRRSQPEHELSRLRRHSRRAGRQSGHQFRRATRFPRPPATRIRSISRW